MQHSYLFDKQGDAGTGTTFHIELQIYHPSLQ